MDKKEERTREIGTFSVGLVPNTALRENKGQM